MRTNMYILAYNRYSRGARLLREAFKCKLVSLDNMHSLPTDAPYVLNWGAAPNRFDATGVVLNQPKVVNICSDKVRFFEAVKGAVRIPEFTKDLDEALSWVESGQIVMGRNRRGSCGKDILFYEEEALDSFVKSDFYVQYKKKKEEFRVHVFDGEVILVQRKALRRLDTEGKPIDTSNVNYRIRNLSNGFIFQRNDIEAPEDVLTQARLAVEKVGLDFGAVDVIWNEYEQKAYVLEINTAPGLEGSTVGDYTAAIARKFGMTL
jgi:glutathione synthase/RimK-type ligase-like ATP-grasp enzyme